MQETWVQSLIQEYPTCHRATKSVGHNYWACALEPRSHNYCAHVPPLPKPKCPTAPAPQQERTAHWEAHTPQQSSPRSQQLEKKPAQQQRASTARNNYLKNNSASVLFNFIRASYNWQTLVPNLKSILWGFIWPQTCYITRAKTCYITQATVWYII